jgi:hypothetical protein
MITISLDNSEDTGNCGTRSGWTGSLAETGELTSFNSPEEVMERELKYSTLNRSGNS